MTAINIASSVSTAGNLSRHDMLTWIQNKAHGNKKFTKIEQFSSGVVYCELMNVLFKNAISVKKMNVDAKSEHQFLSNWKLLQIAFRKLGVDKPIPVEKLVQGRFKDNFEFCQWFKRFFDANCSSSDQNDCNNNFGIGRKRVVCETTKVGTTKGPSAPKRILNRHKTYTSIPAGSNTKTDELNENQKQESETKTKMLRFEIIELRASVESMEKMRNLYLEKIQDVERVCSENKDHDNRTTILESRILNILRSTDYHSDDE